MSLNLKLCILYVTCQVYFEFLKDFSGSMRFTHHFAPEEILRKAILAETPILFP